VTRSNYHFFGGVSDSNDLKFKISAMVFLLSFLAVGGGDGWFPVVSISDDCASFPKKCFQKKQNSADNTRKKMTSSR
jgi:hypothetical protein